MAARHHNTHLIKVAADKLNEIRGIIADLRKLKGGPHVVQNDTIRCSAIDGHTKHNTGYAMSRRVRKHIQEIFDWSMTAGPLRKSQFWGIDRIGFEMLLTFAGYNLIHMRNILAEVPA